MNKEGEVGTKTHLR